MGRALGLGLSGRLLQLGRMLSNVGATVRCKALCQRSLSANWPEYAGAKFRLDARSEWLFAYAHLFQAIWTRSILLQA